MNNNDDDNIIMIAFKDANRDFFFFTIFSLRRELSPTRMHKFPDTLFHGSLFSDNKLHTSPFSDTCVSKLLPMRGFFFFFFFLPLCSLTLL